MFRVFLDTLTDYLCSIGRRKRDLPDIIDPLLLQSVIVLASNIRTGKLSSVRLVEACITRIAQINQILNCVVDTNYDEARRLAKESDAIVLQGKADRYPLLGIPFTIKESFEVKGLRHTAGLVKRINVVADRNADVVTRLYELGAIPLAVTNLPELAMFWTSSNNVYGTTSNSYDTRRTAGGSSGGEAALVAAMGIPFGVGSDVGGSVRIPASFNGIFSHKPTPHTVPNYGQLPKVSLEQQEFLCTGPLCRRANDLKFVFKNLTGNIPELRLDEKVDVRKLKFYYMEGPDRRNLVSPVHPDIVRAMSDVASRLKAKLGVSVIKIQLHDLRYSYEIWSAMMATTATTSYAEQLADGEGRIYPAWELSKWLFRRSEHTLPAICLALQERGDPDQRYVDMCADLKNQFEQLLGDDGVMFYPTNPRVAPLHGQAETMPFNFSFTAIFNVLGLPVTQCPIGLSEDGVPIGMQVIANRNNDRLTLAVAKELDELFGLGNEFVKLDTGESENNFATQLNSIISI